MRQLPLLPLYVNFFSIEKSQKDQVTSTYKIEETDNDEFPFQLFRWKSSASNHWQNLSIYTSISDCLRVLLKEISSNELKDEVDHGQATINPQLILEKMDGGARSVSIFNSVKNIEFRQDVDIFFDRLVERANYFDYTEETAPVHKTQMETMSMVLRNLKSKNQDHEFFIRQKGILSLKNKQYGEEDIRIIKTYRFEGETDPADQAIIYVVKTNDGNMGYSIDAYGLYASHTNDPYGDFIHSAQMTHPHTV